MRLLRTLVILLALPLLLPWGAFSGPTAAAVAAKTDDAAHASAQGSLEEARIDRMPKRCRTAILGGAGCVTDAMIAGAAITPQAAQSRSARATMSGLLGDGLPPETDPDPPRAC